MRPIRRQAGAALIALVAVLVIAVTAGLISLLNTALGQGATNRNHNAAALQQAKDALIGYVVKEVLDLSNPMPGRLPCPEAAGDAGTSLEGRASGSCSAATTVGRLPWRTLGIDKLVDAASEPLWYAVSPNWAGSGATLINTGTAGQLSVDGVPDVVAVILAPGAALTTSPATAQTAAPYSCAARVQTRADRSHVPTGGDPNPADYLECANATLPPTDVRMGSTIVGNDTNPVLNDQVVYVTAKDILNAIQGPVTERMQKTVAPLLSEYSSNWVGSGTFRPGTSNTFRPRLLPYARTFGAPEDSTALRQQFCGGTTPQREGQLPVALMALAGDCASPWSGFAWNGSVGTTSCTSVSGNVTCQFTYYTLRSFTLPIVGSVNLFELLTLAIPDTIDVTLQTSAPHGASAFRRTLAAADFTLTDPTNNVTNASFTQTPNTLDGRLSLTVLMQITDASLCVDTPGAFSVVCNTLTNFGSVCNAILGPFLCGFVPVATLSTALTTPHTISVHFPALSDPTVQGTTAAGMGGVTPPMSLLNPATNHPHYWFFANEWYRYTYYAVSPDTSAAASGGNLTVDGFPSEFADATVSGFPPAFGPNAKRFVLTVMGPATSNQTSRPSTLVAQYLEGQNASPNDNTFAYQVFVNSGNDRIAACPFTAGGTLVCN
jgi:hypothetical protein